MKWERERGGNEWLAQEITLVVSITSFLHNHCHKTAGFKEQWMVRMTSSLLDGGPSYASVTVFKMQTRCWRLSSLSHTGMHRCFRWKYLWGKRLRLPWAKYSHQTLLLLPPFLTTGYHATNDMLTDTSTMLTVIRTSLCCTQGAQCYPKDAGRVQQAITLPEQTWSPQEMHSTAPRSSPPSPSLSLLSVTWKICIPQVSTREKKKEPKSKINQSPATSDLILHWLGNKESYSSVIYHSKFSLPICYIPHAVQSSTYSVLTQTSL